MILQKRFYSELIVFLCYFYSKDQLGWQLKLPLSFQQQILSYLSFYQ